MNDLQIFDSLAHPTLNKNWIMPKYSGATGIEQLIAGMDANGISKALAVGMKDIGGYEDSKFIELIETCSGRLVPIAFFDLHHKSDLAETAERLKSLKTLGFKGIKLHPRISGFSLAHPLLASLIQQANELRLCVLLCTYFYDGGNTAHCNNFEKLPGMLNRLDGAQVMLLHGGTVRLLETIEMVRSHPNVLLDLSFTLCKFRGSSLDMDIQFAFNSFDERICVGSDFPEFSPKVLRERFEYFAKGMDRDKAEKIAFGNLAGFLQRSCE